VATVAMVAAVPGAIRAIITDVDGTLMPFATSSKLSNRNRAALTAAKEAGCAISVATGRIPGPWYDSLCSQLPGVLGPGVFSNGALVLKGDEVFHASVLPAETVATVVECLVDGRVHGRKIGALAVVAADGFEYSELAPEGPTWVTRLIQRAGEPVTPRGSWNPWLLQREVHKFVMFTAPDDPSWAAMDQVVPLLREKLAMSATVLDCGAKQCEILPPGENKGTGVQRLLSVLGIDESEAMACGDAVNDVEMLKLVAKGVAMGDGTSIAQAAADVVVAAHTEDGVAEAIERYVL